MLSGIHWYGHATVKIEAKAGPIIIDQYRLRKKEAISAILITHPHYDHMSSDDLKLVRGEKTTVVAAEDCVKELGPHTKVIAPGYRIDLGDFKGA